MKTCDWRQLPAEVIAPWYERERSEWERRLGWDTAGNWRSVEAARQTGQLPGLVAFDQSEAVGWSFFLRHREALQIGALAALSDIATRALLDAVIAAPEANEVHQMMAFLPAAPVVDHAFASSAFDLHRYLYLTRTLTPPRGSRGVGEPIGHLTSSVVIPCARLFARAYPPVEAGRPFVPTGTDDEWMEYVARLLSGTACGVWRPDLTVLRTASRVRSGLDGAVLTTQLSASTAHIAQLAVEPSAQGKGLGRAMLEAVLARAADAGFRQITLLVADTNAGARHLYQQLGFEEAARFHAAVRDQPRRSTSAACSTGGVITRR